VIAARVIAVCCALGSVATAAPRVLVVHSDGDEQRGLGARAEAELVSLGFAVTVEPPTTEPLDQLSRDQSAVAALRIGDGIEVFCMDPATHETIVRQVLIGPERSVVVVRAVELVRASLLEVAARHVVAEVHVAPPPPPREHVFTAEAGPAIAASPGGVGPIAEVAVAVRWRPRTAFEISAGVLAPAVASTVSGDAGRAAIQLTAPTVEASYVTAVAGIELRAGGGAGAAWLRMRGTPAPGFVARDADVVTSLGFVRGSIGRTVADRVRLWLDLRLAVAAPRPVVVFAGDSVAAWGRPAVIGGAGVEVALW
jgi:hypothetical protein